MDDQVKGAKIENSSNIKVYSKGIKFDKAKLNFSQTKDKIGKSIKDLVSDIEGRNDSIDILKSIYAYLGELEEKNHLIDEIEIESPEYYSLTKYSKKKFLVKKLIEKFPNKKERKKILADAIGMQGFDSDMAESLKGIGLDPLIPDISELFTLTSNIEMMHLRNTFAHDMDTEYQNMLINILKSSGAEQNIIEKFEEEMGKSDGVKTITNDNTPINSNEVDFLQKIETSNRKHASDFNPMIYDLDLGLGLKLFNLNRLKEIYKTIFYKIVTDISKEYNGINPSFNELLYIQKSKFKNKFEEKKEDEKQIFQYTIEWDIKDDLSANDLKEIVKILNKEGAEFNLNPISEKKVFNHPVKTSEGIQEYSGHFDNNGNEFLGESLIIIENRREKTKKLRLTLNHFTQDLYTYFLSQISYYINNKKSIEREQLYFSIYDRYNKEIYGNDENYDISFFKEQYSSLMEKIVIPLSSEGKELGIQAHNTLLAGIYGSGKSQFLLKLLKDKKFEYNGKKFKLNANVIYLDLQSFKAMLATSLGGIRTKLDEIYQNTGTPILLVIEDIDTLINEKIHGVNDEIAQAMTLFFEGIGSIPINVVATANEPSKLSERLIRPNRIYEIIEFYLPNFEEKKHILELHLENKGITISDKIKEKLTKTKVFKNGTASHLAMYCDQLKSKIKIQEALGNNDYKLSDDEILNMANTINISSRDITETIERIQKWVGNVTGNGNGSGNIGFVQTNC